MLFTMSDSEDEVVQSKTIKITVVGEPSTGKVRVYYLFNSILGQVVNYTNVIKYS